MKKHDYIAKVSTGDVLGAESKRALYRNLKHYFDAFPDAWYAEVRIDNVPREFVWRTPDGMNAVPVVE